MRFLPLLAPLALFGTMAFGSALSSEAAGCSSKAFARYEDISAHDIVAQIQSTTHEACAKWVEGSGSIGTFDSTSFKLKFSGSIEATSIENCTSAIEMIIEYCSLGDDFFGGSIVSQGVEYSIEEVGRVTGPDTGTIQERATDLGKLKAKKPKIPAGKPLPKKPSANRPLNKPSTQKPSTRKPSTRKPSTQKPSTQKPSTQKPSTQKPSTRKPSTQKPSTQKPSTQKPSTQKPAKSCQKSGEDRKKKTQGNGRKLTGRSILLDLIQRSNLDKRNSPKKGTACEHKFNAGKYPRYNQVVNKKQTQVMIFGFEKCDVTAWNDGIGPVPNQEQGWQVEHVLEWQTVTGFFDHLGKVAPGFCDSWPKDWLSVTDTPIITGIEFESVKSDGTFEEHIARAYPSMEHYFEEFLILEARANTPMKVNLFKAAGQMLSDEKLNMEDFSKALDNLRDAIGAGKYLIDPKVNSLYAIQTIRMQRTLAQLDKAMANVPGKNWKPVGRGFEVEWEQYMEDVWTKATRKLIDFLEEKPSLIYKKYNCKKPLQKDVNNCRRLENIEKVWAGINKTSLRQFPWEKGTNSAAPPGDPMEGVEGDLSDVSMEGT